VSRLLGNLIKADQDNAESKVRELAHPAHGDSCVLYAPHGSVFVNGRIAQDVEGPGIDTELLNPRSPLFISAESDV
jgi:hypothetical protein